MSLQLLILSLGQQCLNLLLGQSIFVIIFTASDVAENVLVAASVTDTDS